MPDDEFDVACDEAYAELPEDLREALERAGIQMVVEHNSPDGPNIAGCYVPFLRTIFLYRRAGIENVRQVMIHEACHALGFSHAQMAKLFPEISQSLKK